jgi:multidrug resistance efflux pump
MADILTAENIEWARQRSLMKDKLAKVDIDIAAICASHEALRARCDQAEGELRQIDALMARRPALDEPTRYANIAKAIHTAKRCEQAERKLDEWRRDYVVVRGDREAPRDYVVVRGDREAPRGYVVEKAFRGALDQDRDELRDRIAALEANIREWRKGFVVVLAPHDSLLAESLALVPDETGKTK